MNTFCYSNQADTFLDVLYDDFESLSISEVLLPSKILELTTPLPEQKPLAINVELPVLIYNFYNLDPIWKKELSANRILLLEPSTKIPRCRIGATGL